MSLPDTNWVSSSLRASSRKQVAQQGTDAPSGPNRSDRDVYKFLISGKQHFVKPQYEDALSQFQQAAEMGNAEAMAYLGKLYYQGLGVAPDRRKAIEWLKTGAERGEVLAMESLGTIYEPNSQFANPAEERRWKLGVGRDKNVKGGCCVCDQTPSGTAGKNEPDIPSNECDCEALTPDSPSYCPFGVNRRGSIQVPPVNHKRVT